MGSGAPHGSPVPTPPPGAARAFHLPAPNSPPASSSHPQLLAHAHAHAENPISPSSFPIPFVVLAVRTLSCVLCSQQPGSVPLAMTGSLPLLQSQSHLQARSILLVLIPQKRLAPSASPLLVRAVNNTRPLLASWKAAVSQCHLQINSFHLATDHLLLAPRRHAGLSSLLPDAFPKSSCALEPACAAGALFAAEKKKKKKPV